MQSRFDVLFVISFFDRFSVLLKGFVVLNLDVDQSKNVNLKDGTC